MSVLMRSAGVGILIKLPNVIAGHMPEERRRIGSRALWVTSTRRSPIRGVDLALEVWVAVALVVVANLSAMVEGVVAMGWCVELSAGITMTVGFSFSAMVEVLIATRSGVEGIVLMKVRRCGSQTTGEVRSNFWVGKQVLNEPRLLLI